jgi:hypothetical protein
LAHLSSGATGKREGTVKVRVSYEVNEDKSPGGFNDESWFCLSIFIKVNNQMIWS